MCRYKATNHLAKLYQNKCCFFKQDRHPGILPSPQNNTKDLDERTSSTSTVSEDFIYQPIMAIPPQSAAGK